MTKGDIGQIIKRLNVMSKKGRAKMNRDPFLALGELPSGRQITELKTAAKEMSKIHRAVMRLATGR